MECGSTKICHLAKLHSTTDVFEGMSQNFKNSCLSKHLWATSAELGRTDLSNNYPYWFKPTEKVSYVIRITYKNVPLSTPSVSIMLLY